MQKKKKYDRTYQGCLEELLDITRELEHIDKASKEYEEKRKRAKHLKDTINLFFMR